MNKPAGRERAILRPTSAAEHIAVDRAAPPAALAAYVDYFWSVAWNTDQPHEQEVIPLPVVHISAEVVDGVPRLMATGVQRRRFVTRLEGRGFTLAAAFRAACFRPFLGARVAALVDVRRPLGDVLDVEDRPVAEVILSRGGPDDVGYRLLGDWLQALPHRPDPRCDDLAAVVERVEKDPALTRAEQLAELAGVSLRTLQRQFAEYVGVGPKWVVQRFRLLDVAAAAHSGGPVDWAQVAADLGFSDQSHLVRAFSALVGSPPAAYTRRA